MITGYYAGSGGLFADRVCGLSNKKRKAMSKHGPDSFTAAEFRAACAMFPTGVTVVTRLMSDGRPHGITVSSFTSLSLHPPLLLVCIDLRASFLHGLTEGDAFAINVLSETQQDLSVRFSKPHEQGRFHQVLWHQGERGVPLLSGAVASFECELSGTVDAGDHRILIGHVRQFEYRERRPLVWHRASYNSIASSAQHREVLRKLSVRHSS